MKKINSITVAVIMAFSFSQFNVEAQNKQEIQTKKNKTEKDVYTCPMHKDIVSDKPGKCEKCGMALKRKAGKMNMMKMMGEPFFEKTVDGLKFQIWLQTQEEHRKMMSENMGKMGHGKGMMHGMNDSLMMKMMSGTHHVAVKITDIKTGKEVGNKVEIKMVSPSQKSASTYLIKREKHFGNGLSLEEKGRYQLTAIVTLKNNISKVQFTYEIN